MYSIYIQSFFMKLLRASEACWERLLDWRAQYRTKTLTAASGKFNML